MRSLKNGFFYNCGKALFYIIIIIILYLIVKLLNVDYKSFAMIEKVDAITGTNPNGGNVFWYDKYTHTPLNATYSFDNNNFKDFEVYYNHDFNSNSDHLSVLRTSNTTSNRIFIRHNYLYKKNHNYTTKVAFCYTGSNPTSTNYTSVRNLGNDVLTTNYFYSGLSPFPYSVNNTLPEFKHCDEYSYNFDLVSDDDIDWLVDYTYSFNISGSHTFYLMYIDVSDNGFSTSLATSIYTMVSDIQTYQNSIENGINNVNNSIQNQTNAMNSNQAQTNSNLNKINDSLNDDNVDGANSSASGFFDSFESSDYGLSDVLTMPLHYITSISSAQCSPLSIPIPFVNQNAELPCMYSIYQQYFGSFLTIYQIITTGFISYWIFINIFALVRGFSNPFSDKVEVLDL